MVSQLPELQQTSRFSVFVAPGTSAACPSLDLLAASKAVVTTSTTKSPVVSNDTESDKKSMASQDTDRVGI